MRILALETANTQCSVALTQDQTLLFFAQNQDMRAQTQHILPMIEQAMHETAMTWSDIDGIAFSRGPGAFSGVRINAAVAQALAWAHDIAVVPVSSLQALAQQGARHGLRTVMTVLDARMNEVYAACYQCDDNGIMQPKSDEQLLDYAAAQTIIDDRNFCKSTEIIGSGAALIGAAQNALHADAHDIAILATAAYEQGLAVSAAQALPVYLRDNAWKTLAEQSAQ